MNKWFIILRHCASKNCSFVYFHVQLKDYLSKGDGRWSEELVRAFSFFIEPTAIKRLLTLITKRFNYQRLTQNNARDGGKMNAYPRQSTVECATSSVPTASSVFTLVFTL